MTDGEPIVSRTSSKGSTVLESIRRRVSAASTTSGGDSETDEQYSDTEPRVDLPTNFGLRGISNATSGCFFNQAFQTLIFFDWDDTLFPTTELLDRQGIVAQDKPLHIPEQLAEDLKAWRRALCGYLEMATSLSDHCVIVTNSRRPWVTECIDNFVPEAAAYIGDGPGMVKVVYADEVPEPCTHKARQGFEGLRPVRYGAVDRSEELRAKCMRAKRAAMHVEAERFYSQYPGQTWKNTLSIGDMPYEHDALQDVTFRRRGPSRENCRTKTIMVPSEPTIGEITLRLQFSKRMLPAYVHYDGSIDVDLAMAPDPLRTLAEALEFPELMSCGFPRFAWGIEEAPSPDIAENALHSLSCTVQEFVSDRALRYS